MDRAVKGATKSKCAAPKQKYLEVLISATTRVDNLETIFISLDHRLRENSWTIVFKSLIVIHILMRKGAGDQVLNYLVRRPSILNVSGFRDKSGTGNEQTKNIHSYAAYLEEKVSVYRELKIDFVKEKKSDNRNHLRKLTVAKGLLRVVKFLQQQLDALLNCKFFLDEVDNNVTLTAFKLIVTDLLSVFETINEGVINVLDQFISMSQIDARDGLEIYKKFVKQTEKVVSYLKDAQKLEFALGFSIPNLKHAPVSLTIALQDYAEDPKFEANRREYERMQKEKGNKNKSSTKSTTKSTSTISSINNDGNIIPSSKKDTTSTTTTTSKTSSANNNQIEFINFSSDIGNEQTLRFDNQFIDNNNSLGRHNTIISTTATTATNPFLNTQNPLVLQQQHHSPIINQQQLILNHISVTPSSLSPATSDTNPFRASIAPTKFTSFT
ncbi:21921_t:CDS:2 [Entrophospora sp. SA101]|nr:21921_t:CDS:2 [Entrophospora sp. SA101]CAJ0832239.1 2096_t:CDS:2 [Entrophospora sp. SA101]CAJ0886491.1 5039_t:CDS:2 [Entrophospora sp. SA101]